MRVKIGAVEYDSSEYPICIEFTEEEQRCLAKKDFKGAAERGEKTKFSAVPKHYFPNRKAHENWVETV